MSILPADPGRQATVVLRGTPFDQAVAARAREKSLCVECGREVIPGNGSQTNHRMGDPREGALPGVDWLCKSCWKRVIWRPRNNWAVERDREASRAWKRAHLGQPGRRAA